MGPGRSAEASIESTWASTVASNACSCEITLLSSSTVSAASVGLRHPTGTPSTPPAPASSTACTKAPENRCSRWVRSSTGVDSVLFSMQATMPGGTDNPNTSSTQARNRDGRS